MIWSCMKTVRKQISDICVGKQARMSTNRTYLYNRADVELLLRVPEDLCQVLMYSVRANFLLI